jgi:hypothetical protein
MCGYTVIACSSCSARCCAGFGVVVIWKVESRFLPTRAWQVLRTMVESSARSVRKLWTGDRSVSVRVATFSSAEFHVERVGNVPVVDGQVNGQPIRIPLETGSTVSYITDAAAHRLGTRAAQGAGAATVASRRESPIFWRIFRAGFQSRPDRALIDDLNRNGDPRLM